MTVGMILAGGSGSRFGGDIPKQYLKVFGREVISYSIFALRECSEVDKIVVVASNDQKDRIENQYGVTVVPNGSTRNRSLRNGLEAISKFGNVKKIIILEAARPMITSQIIEKYIKLLDGYDCVITGQKITDSLGCYKKHITDREDYYAIQAPEAFNFNKLYANFDSESNITATNQQMPEGSSLYINFDFIDNYKITYPMDLAYCEELMKRRIR